MDDFTFRFKVGHFDCYIFQDRHDRDSIVSPRNVLLIHTGQQQILIDPGLGQDLIPGSPYPGLLRDKLREADISLAKIDQVIFSHADLDHIGGAVDESSKPAFPNARYILHRQELDFWSLKPERLQPPEAHDDVLRQVCRDIPQTRLAQLRDRLECIDSGAEIVPGIKAVAAHGHTPGHMAISVASGHDRLLFIGDLMYEPQNIEDPGWYSIYDFDPPQAIMTRQRILPQATQDQTLLMAYHLPFPGLGYVRQKGAGWRWIAYDRTE